MSKEKLPTLPGQDGVPAWVIDYNAFFILTCSALPSPPPGRHFRELAAFGMLRPTGKTKGIGGGTRGMGALKKPPTQAGNNLSTPEEHAAYKALFDRMVGSVRFWATDGNEEEIPTIKVAFVPEDQFSHANLQLGDLFYERNHGLYSGDFVRVGGQIRITGSLASSTQGIKLRWENSFDSFDGQSYRTNIYCLTTACPARGSPEELWSAAEKQRWPAQQLQAYNSLARVPHHFSIADMAQWVEWADHNGIPWHLEGTERETLNGFCGPDERDKTTIDGGSMLYPQRYDPASFSESTDDAPVGGPQASGAGTVLVRGSIGNVTYNYNDPVNLWNGCSDRTVNAILFPITCLVTVPVAWCAVCKHVEGAMQIGPCGHGMCAGCNSACVRICSLCSGAEEQLRRSNAGMKIACKRRAEKAVIERDASAVYLQAAIRRRCSRKRKQPDTGALPSARPLAQGGAWHAAPLAGPSPAPKRPTSFYHATSLHNALAIQAQGFKVPPGSGGMLGAGVYCTTTLKKAFDYAKCKHGGVIFELCVDLGRCKILAPGDPMMRTWQEHGFDSAWHPTGAVNRPGDDVEENCVKDPRNVKVVRPIPGHTGRLLAAGYAVIGDKLVRL